MADPIETFLNRLQHPVMTGIGYKLDRMVRLLSLLHNPHHKLPPVIHVAGTNGKGSLIAYLKAIFEQAGYKPHVYTSPHLVAFRERIVIAGEESTNAQIESALKHVATVLQEQPATFFEAATAAAFLMFAQKKADVLLLETGLGGRLDATNVINKPALTAITPISMDHMEYLGETLSLIASEKAGIIKAAVPCVVGKQSPEAMHVLREKALQMHAPILALGEQFSWNRSSGQAMFESGGVRLPLIPSLAGEHQLDNAATAVACIKQLPQYTISDEHIIAGLMTAKWPARIQKLKAGPLVDMLPPTVELWLDGGHNPQGGEVLGAWMATQNRPIYMVCGMVQGKSSEGYLSHLAPHVKKLVAIAIPEESSSQKPEAIAACATKCGIDSVVASSPQAALSQLVDDLPQSALVVIAGSLYLSGFILKNHG